MFIQKNYFRQWNNNEEITNYKEFYKEFSNKREFGGSYSNWDHLRKSRFNNTINHMYNAILRKKPSNILDIGCGDGINLPLANIFHWVSYEGIDYAEKTIEAAKRDYPNVKFKVGDAFNLPYSDKSFDMAIMSSVLILYKNEEDRIKLLKEAYRVLKDDGILIINVWNDTFIIRNCIRLSEFLGKIHKDKLPEDFMGCHFTPQDVYSMVNKSNFIISQRIKTGELWGVIECARYLNRNKYHRDFGNEAEPSCSITQNINKDVIAYSKKKYTKFMLNLYSVFPNQFSYYNLYILKKKV